MHKNLFKFFIIFTLSLMPFYSTSYANENALTLKWLDLIPEDDRINFSNDFANSMNNQVNHEIDTPIQPKFGSMRKDLDGQLVRIPGFVIPLEGDNNVVTEFLLVPYMGACIHVPPPPPNQIVYVKFKDGAPINELWQTVVIEGILKVETTNSDLAEVGYLLEGIKVLPYED